MKAKVKIDPKTRPGLKACGRYAVGQEYELPVEEAARLVQFKGFKPVSADDKKAVDAAIKQAEAAEKKEAAAAESKE